MTEFCVEYGPVIVGGRAIYYECPTDCRLIGLCAFREDFGDPGRNR